MCKISIEYSIVSRGTERYNNCGYMAISGIYDSYRYILNVDHNIRTATLSEGYLKAKSCYEISNIVFSRFQLITALLFERHKYKIDDNILILGLGNVGVSCLIYLIDNGFKNITIYVRQLYNKIVELLKVLKKNYSVNINVIDNLNKKNDFNTYIDTTGDSLVLKSIFENAGFNNTIIILSTPRAEKFLISPLMINRKNLLIIGGHELNGVDKEKRQEIFEKILEANKNKKYLKKLINEYDFSDKRLNSIKQHKSNFIEMFKY